MITLFEVQGDTVIPTLETRLLEPFKTIWERDTSPGKSQAIREITYIEFLCSPKKTNPFSGYSEQVRAQKIVERIFKDDPGFTPDPLVLEAIELYEQLLEEGSYSLSYLNAARQAADELKNFLTTVNLNERTRLGAPVYKPKDITAALKDTNDMIKNFMALEERVNAELMEASRTKSNREINHFEK